MTSWVASFYIIDRLLHVIVTASFLAYNLRIKSLYLLFKAAALATKGNCSQFCFLSIKFNIK